MPRRYKSAPRRGPKYCALVVASMILAVGGCPINEVEDNSVPQNATFIRNTEFGQAAINPVTDVDFWRAPAAAGDLVFAVVDTQESTSGKDSLLQLIATDGGTLIDEDDDDGPGGAASGSALAGVSVSAAGNVYFRVNEKDNDSQINLYRLHQLIVSPDENVAESEPNDGPAQATAITAPIARGDVSGSIDYFKFEAVTGQKIAAILDKDPDGNNILSDIVFEILRPNQATLISGDSANGTDADAAVGVALETGTHYVRLADNSGADLDYRFVVLIDGIPWIDADADGIGAAQDNCPDVANASQLDSDDDGAGDACDDCPNNDLKIVAGECGCNQPDVDFNADGVVDCDLADLVPAMLSGPGLLLIPDRANDRVMAFDPVNGAPIDPHFISDAAHIPDPTAAILGPGNDTFLVSDVTNNVVQAYDFDGNYIGVFAPTGGADTSILETPTGLALRPNGNLLVAVGTGTNADAIAEFDNQGNYLGNFVANGAGGLQGPQDVIFYDGRLLVSAYISDRIHAYDASTGAFVNTFAVVNNAPIQLAESVDGNLLAANFSGNHRGIVEFSPEGNLLAHTAAVGTYQDQGVFQLPSKHLLTSSAAGICRIDVDGKVIARWLPQTAPQFIKRAVIDSDGDGVGDDVDVCPDTPDPDQPGGICAPPGCGTCGAGFAPFTLCLFPLIHFARMSLRRKP